MNGTIPPSLEVRRHAAVQHAQAMRDARRGRHPFVLAFAVCLPVWAAFIWWLVS